MKNMLVNALLIALPIALFPSWVHFAPWLTVQIFYPSGFSQDAMVSISHSLILFPYCFWIAFLLLQIQSKI